MPNAFRADADALRRHELLLTAVDRARVRAAIGRLAHTRTYGGDPPVFWLDAGNSDREVLIPMEPLPGIRGNQH